jgi:FkbM family methyltransferase
VNLRPAYTVGGGATLSYKRRFVRLLDRPGGRYLLGKMATNVLRRISGGDFEIEYVGGLWTRRIGPYFLPDSLRFDYTLSDFDSWKRRIEQYEGDTKEYWLQHYRPRDGDIVVDVGAGRGEDTLTFSRAVGKGGRVIAIEGHPVTFAILKSFCQLNGLANVTPVQVALMDKPGIVRMVESRSSWMENAIDTDERDGGIPVRAATLDQVCDAEGIDRITFLKVNIEGAERRALLGMESVLPHVEQICVACHDFRADLGHGEHFRTRGFVEKFLLDRGFVLRGRREDPRDYVRDHVFGLRVD